MPSWSEVLVLLPFFSETSAVLGLVVTSTLIALLRDWRFSILILLVQYVLANVLLIHFVPAEIALFKFIVGAMICLILFVSARRAEKQSVLRRHIRWKGGVRVWAQPEVFGTGFPFRLLAVVLMGLIVFAFLQRFSLNGVSLFLNFAIYWLSLNGLLIMMLTGRPLKAGVGLLTFVTAFELYHVTVERGLVVTGLIGVLHLMVALSLAYLIIIRTVPVEEELAEE
jgi:hypothetical protein